ncbi:MAG TPA: 50S ribosomal protein L37e [Candidatus Caldiarchaeum subterraneum]|uniref:Large ribosomal subunit protein eL37 n=1 Tax=Caldiarchaeum subterraneum TaxID=311458 RepID=A0A832ZXH4_CALS0|nr:50S ribosomal protein L37e [Aigarchaeota archaeon]HIQ29131.1 50S ribosomal protein L37e [Candidatus Caldarchaeum subterraneum]
MTKGTSSMGKYNKPTHIKCRRCGRRAFHIHKKRCASCGFPDPKRRKYNWIKPKKLLK